MAYTELIIWIKMCLLKCIYQNAKYVTLLVRFPHNSGIQGLDWFRNRMKFEKYIFLRKGTKLAKQFLNRKKRYDRFLLICRKAIKLHFFIPQNPTQYTYFGHHHDDLFHIVFRLRTRKRVKKQLLALALSCTNLVNMVLMRPQPYSTRVS